MVSLIWIPILIYCAYNYGEATAIQNLSPAVDLKQAKQVYRAIQRGIASAEVCDEMNTQTVRYIVIGEWQENTVHEYFRFGICRFKHE